MNRGNWQHRYSNSRTRPSGSVSRALWPTTTRKGIPTTRAAQHRRALLKCMRWLPLLNTIKKPPIRRSLKNLPIRRSLKRYLNGRILQLTLSIMTGLTALVLCLLYDWSMLLILTLICMTTTLMLTHQFFKAEQARSILPDEPADYAQPINHEIPPPIPHTFPNTPMPATPLIRILETIDLSSTNIEHFLDIKSELPQPPPPDLRGSPLTSNDKQRYDNAYDMH